MEIKANRKITQQNEKLSLSCLKVHTFLCFVLYTCNYYMLRNERIRTTDDVHKYVCGGVFLSCGAVLVVDFGAMA